MVVNSGDPRLRQRRRHPLAGGGMSPPFIYHKIYGENILFIIDIEIGL